jgi:hypothetical protein
MHVLGRLGCCCPWCCCWMSLLQFACRLQWCCFVEAGLRDKSHTPVTAALAAPARHHLCNISPGALPIDAHSIAQQVILLQEEWRNHKSGV